MIIVDTSLPQRPDDHKGGNASPEGPTPSVSQTPPPPPPPPPYIDQPYYPAREHVVAVVVYRQSPTLRFWKAFGVAVLIWLLCAKLSHSVANMASNHRHGHVCR